MQLKDYLNKHSSDFSEHASPISIILAAGHGKRIKSHRSKMLHTVWGVPTVVRVCRAVQEGLQSLDQIVVVGIKAKEVAASLKKQTGRKFVFQAEQKGTGHAVKVALDKLKPEELNRDIYVVPGDMGLLDATTVSSFKDTFVASAAHMMVMVANYSGPPQSNYYGRIIRVPDRDITDKKADADKGKIIQIMEYKDILALDPKIPYKVKYRGRKYSFKKQELLELSEFNSGLYAFKGKYLSELLNKIGFDNVQGEMYLTDLIYLFNKQGLSVNGAPAIREDTVLGFNDKAVLNQMRAIARSKVYNKINKIISIADRNNFFIADEVVANLLEIDKSGASLDISIGEGVHLGSGVRLNEGVFIEKNSRLEGNIILGKGVHIGESVYMTTFSNQKIVIGTNSIVMQSDILKGNIRIGSNCLIETPVRLTGNDEYPLRIGNNVRIKGATYIFGSIIADGVFIINCVLRQKRIVCKKNKKGNIIPVCYIFPEPQGKECLKDL